MYAPGNSVTKFPYDRLVATGEVNREEWANIVRALWLDFTPDGKNPKKAPFARLLGVDITTLDNWLNCSVNVKEASVRQVADRTENNAMEWLIQVGYYTLDELPDRPQLPNAVVDEEMRAVLDDPTLTDAQKAMILEELDTWRAEDEQVIEVQRDRDKRRRLDRLHARIAHVRQDQHS